MRLETRFPRVPMLVCGLLNVLVPQSPKKDAGIDQPIYRVRRGNCTTMPVLAIKIALPLTITMSLHDTQSRVACRPLKKRDRSHVSSLSIERYIIQINLQMADRTE